ncbi:signal peptide-containing protein [Theileria equi strain WA]|uniref:Signal peptide-containing protein n=1 Tax=Theileria equi strain WA TaxID=1537102 RepID=L0B136_THEEQ|nr:signal peptide-containing protein [Theileria equi strain WA]AFZ80941.1 signal peptide-containing protein [Theileria equi strain WA]|eukprot:XP_004830607.1 signal peptide-containing protein [Theileria equi strain WA]
MRIPALIIAVCVFRLCGKSWGGRLEGLSYPGVHGASVVDGDGNEDEDVVVSGQFTSRISASTADEAHDSEDEEDDIVKAVTDVECKRNPDNAEDEDFDDDEEEDYNTAKVRLYIVDLSNGDMRETCRRSRRMFTSDANRTRKSRRSRPKDIDITDPDENLCKSFDYYYDDVPTKFIVPNRRYTIGKLLDGATEIWKAENGESCTYCYLHYRDKTPILVHMLEETKTGENFKTLIKGENRVWGNAYSYSDALSRLRIPVEQTTQFLLNLTADSDTAECRIFNSTINDVTVRFYIPMSGFHANKVYSGAKELWACGSTKSVFSSIKGTPKERVIILTAYFKDGRHHLIKMITKDSNGKSDSIHFEERSGDWDFINSNIFEDKRKKLGKVSTS